MNEAERPSDLGDSGDSIPGCGATPIDAPSEPWARVPSVLCTAYDGA